MVRESKNDGLQQVATRVSDEAHRVLELAATAEQKSMTDLLRPTVEQYAEQLAREPEIAQMLVQARKYEARKPWKLSGARPVISSISQLSPATIWAANPQMYNQTKWGKASSSRKNTVNRERRRSSSAVRRTGWARRSASARNEVGSLLG